jgi:hypothetical protein
LIQWETTRTILHASATVGGSDRIFESAQGRDPTFKVAFTACGERRGFGGLGRIACDELPISTDLRTSVVKTIQSLKMSATFWQVAATNSLDHCTTFKKKLV